MVVIIEDSEIIHKLQSFGLTKYESEIYFWLLKYRILTASKLGKLSNVPITRIYDTAKSLVNKGLVGIVNDVPKQYGALPFEDTFKTLIDEKHEAFIKELDQLESEKNAIMKHISKSPERDMIDTEAFCYTVNGKRALVKLWHSLFLNAKKEIFIFSGDSQWINAELARLKSIARKKIDIRVLANTKYRENLNPAKEIGIRVRFSDNLLRGVIVDRKHLYISNKHTRLKDRNAPPYQQAENSPKGGEIADAKNCWDFWKCDKLIKERCAAHEMKMGHICWRIVGTSGDSKCPRLKNNFKSCTECPWFCKMNMMDEEYSCIITEDKSIVESLREYFLLKWNNEK